MKKSNYLIIGATSDLATNFIENLDENSNLSVVVRNTENLYNYNYKNIYKCDLKVLESIQKIDFKESYDKIIFYAGIDIIKPFKYYNESEILESFSVNIISILYLIRELLKKKLINQRASIVIINSISGTTKGPKGHVLYSTTKSSINGFVKSLANELSPKQIRINSICPGLIKTKSLFNSNSNIQSVNEFINYEKKYPLKFGSPIDLTNYISFILSESASWITGQNLILDGGNNLE